VNPIFEDESKSVAEETGTAECVEEEQSSPDSPPTDRESVRSSGYGSKETDSVSYKSEVQDEESLNEINKNDKLLCEENNLEFNSTGSVADIRRSFEILSHQQVILNKHDEENKVITANPDYVKNIEVIARVSPALHTIPEITTEPECEQTSQKKLSWPRVSQLAQALQRQAERIHQRREREKFKERLRNRNAQNYKHQVLRFNPLLDSLINEDTLKMMNSPEYEANLMFDERNLPGEKNLTQSTLPNFGKAIYSNFHPNLNRGNSLSSHYSLGKREKSTKNVYRSKINGANVAKDLWEKSGLKTNGRKLLVNSGSLVTDNKTFALQNESQGSLDDVNFGKTKNSSENRKNIAIEDSYEYNPSLIRPSSSCYNFACNSYEYFTNSQKGFDNFGYVNDIGNSMDSLASSAQSKHSYPFQHSLTEFQKRVSDKLQAESNEKGLILTTQSTDNNKYQRNNSNISKNKNYPGKAVQELKLETNGFQEAVSASPSTTSQVTKVGQDGSSNGQKNRMQIWEEFGHRYKDDTFPSYFFRHPNSEAPIFAVSNIILIIYA
ncbi:hypothetical protein Anas_05344, partial [Armadillidium nasatum]